MLRRLPVNLELKKMLNVFFFDFSPVQSLTVSRDKAAAQWPSSLPLSWVAHLWRETGMLFIRAGRVQYVGVQEKERLCTEPV